MASQNLSIANLATFPERASGSRVITDATDHSTTAITATGATDAVNVARFHRVAINVVNGATNSCIFTVEGSLDGTNFFTVAYGAGSSAAYTQGARTTTAATKEGVFLPDADLLNYVRVNISSANANGTTFTVYGVS
jgi:hypothetical protein